MKKFLKFIGFGFIGLIVLGIIAAAISGNDSGSEQKSQETAATPEKQQQEKKDKEVVTISNYEKIEIGDTLTGAGGMTIDEVEKILGKSDNKVESQSGDMKMVVATYSAKSWENIGDTISVTYINGKASGKSQFGLDE